MTLSITPMTTENEQEALTLMLHHLELAAAYFEATPDPLPENWPGDRFSAPAMVAWADAMDRLYPKDEDL